MFHSRAQKLFILSFLFEKHANDLCLNPLTCNTTIENTGMVYIQVTFKT